MLNVKHFKIWLSLFAVIAVTTQALELGRCPYVRTKTDLDVTKLVGDWYEQATFPVPGQSLYKCIVYNYAKTDDGFTMHKTSTGKITGLETGVTGKITWTAPGTFKLTANGIVGAAGDANVSVLDTDYANYATLFSCKEALGLGIVHTRYVTVLTRKRAPEAYYVGLAENALTNNGLSVDKLVAAEQSNC